MHTRLDLKPKILINQINELTHDSVASIQKLAKCYNKNKKHNNLEIFLV